MKKTSIASLQERLAGWVYWDAAAYELGATLGFWPEYGAPFDHDTWHGAKSIIREPNPLGDTLFALLNSLVAIRALEYESPNDNKEAVGKYRWNPKYKGPADIISTLE
jgi:hypothetical protein